MKTTTNEILSNLINRYPILDVCHDAIADAVQIIVDMYSHGGKLIVAGNGGSAADAEHISGELMKSFLCARNVSQELSNELKSVDSEMGEILSNQLQNSVPTIALSGNSAMSTAIMNDGNPQLCFAQQVNGYGNSEDVFLAISTSGNSKNILFAAVVAKAKKMRVIGLSGADVNKLDEYCDVSIKAPKTKVYEIQELHLPIYHAICMMVENEIFL